MKNRIITLTLGLALSLAGVTGARAMSEFTSMTITPLWPETSSPGSIVLYEVAVERTGQGLLEIAMTSDGLPANCVTTFGSDPARFTGRNPRYQYFLMTVACSVPTATDSYAFVITGTARRESISVTNLFRLPVRLGTAAPNLVSANPLGNGDVEIRGMGSTAQTYQIESTTDLVNPVWTSLGSCTADGNGRFFFKQSNGLAVGTSVQYYRAVLVGAGAP